MIRIKPLFVLIMKGYLKIPDMYKVVQYLLVFIDREISILTKLLHYCIVALILIASSYLIRWLSFRLDLNAEPLASKGSKFKQLRRGQKNSLKPFQGLNLKSKYFLTTPRHM